MQIVIIGGGAAGFFAAINAAELNPGSQVTIIEKSSKLLTKVRISGGGRCNVTHSLFEEKELVKKYPRGEKELLGSFYQFSTANTIDWFAQRNVKLKTEEDGRMFPVTDSSQTIIDCLMNEAENLGIEISMNTLISDIVKENDEFIIQTNNGLFHANSIIIASGGNTDETLKNILKKFGHSLIPPVPSLFTFNVPKHPVNNLMGLSVPNAVIEIENSRFKESGPLLITHWGFSGPAILRLSAWAAHFLAERNYKFRFSINWLGEIKFEKVLEKLALYKQQNQSKNLTNSNIELPKRLWQYLLERTEIDEHKKWQELSKSELQKLASVLSKDEYEANGKTTYKEEFVTAGGINRKEIDFRTMESKIQKGLYFAGEVIDIDGITGGFNFQNAWTTGWIAANSISSS